MYHLVFRLSNIRSFDNAWSLIGYWNTWFDAPEPQPEPYEWKPDKRDPKQYAGNNYPLPMSKSMEL